MIMRARHIRSKGPRILFRFRFRFRLGCACGVLLLSVFPPGEIEQSKQLFDDALQKFRAAGIAICFEYSNISQIDYSFGHSNYRFISCRFISLNNRRTIDALTKNKVRTTCCCRGAATSTRRRSSCCATAIAPSSPRSSVPMVHHRRRRETDWSCLLLSVVVVVVQCFPTSLTVRCNPHHK
jgi:hypothetical protein